MIFFFIQSVFELRETFDVTSFADTAIFPDESVPELRSRMKDLFDKSRIVALRLLRAFAYELNKEPEFFDNCHRDIFKEGEIVRIFIFNLIFI